MNNFETTNDFDTLKTISGVVIEFYELMEVAQAGSVVGDRLINGKRLDGRFWGPVVADGWYTCLCSYSGKKMVWNVF